MNAACPSCSASKHGHRPPSHLPDLQAYLQQLLAEAERLRACTDAEAWVIEQATPREEEIQAVRRLIRDIQVELGGLDAAERVSIDEAVTTIRRARAALPARSVVSLPIPHSPPRHLRRRRRGSADRMNHADTSGRPPAATGAPDRTGKMRAGRTDDLDLLRHGAMRQTSRFAGEPILLALPGA